MTIEVTGRPEDVTLSGVSIKNISSEEVVTLNNNNIRMSNNTITLNLSSGGGRETLPEWDDANVEITTTWSNGKTASDTSVVTLPSLTIEAPASFLYNASSVQIAAANVPTGVTLTGVSIKNTSTQTTVNLNSNNWSVS